jgi:hypothetical protein
MLLSDSVQHIFEDRASHEYFSLLEERVSNRENRMNNGTEQQRDNIEIS